MGAPLMAGYAYRLPRKYRYRPRRRYGRNDSKGLLIAVAVIAALVAGTGAKAAVHHDARPAATVDTAAVKAISFARAQLGCPYTWGGAGPCGAGFDCSGLVMEAYASAGITIPRTSEEQWAALPHVSSPRPGDLIFYAGSDGTVTSPGHVVLYIGGGRVIQAYATGYPVMISSLAGMDAGGLTGYARP